MNKHIEQLLSIEERIRFLKASVALSDLVGPDEVTLSFSDLGALLAKLEAAEAKVNHYAAAEYSRNSFDQTADIIKRADEAERKLEAAEKERDDLLDQEFQQRLANAEHQLYMKDLAINNVKASRKAQFRKRKALETENAELKERAEAAEARLLVPDAWIKCNEQMPDPKDPRRVCVFTLNPAADLRYRLVPASLFKAVCSSATHWYYVDDSVEGGE